MTLVKSVISPVSVKWTIVSLVIIIEIWKPVIVTMSVTRIGDGVGVTLDAVFLPLKHDVVRSSPQKPILSVDVGCPLSCPRGRLGNHRAITSGHKKDKQKTNLIFTTLPISKTKLLTVQLIK